MIICSSSVFDNAHYRNCYNMNTPCRNILQPKLASICCISHGALLTLIYKGLTVGSHVHGEYSFVDSASISSFVSSKSYTLAFSSIRDGVTDLGRGTKP